MAGFGAYDYYDDAHEMRCDGSPNPPRTNPIKRMLKIKNPWKIMYCTVTPYSQCDNIPSRTDEKQPVFVKPTPLERQTKSVERRVAINAKTRPMSQEPPDLGIDSLLPWYYQTVVK